MGEKEKTMDTPRSGYIHSTKLKVKTEWCVDSGSTHHMCKDKELFSGLTLFPKPRPIEGATKGMESCALGQGDITLESKGTELTLRSALYVPSLHANLLSICLLDKEGLTVTFTSGEVCISDRDGHCVGKGRSKDNLYTLQYPSQARESEPKKARTAIDSQSEKAGDLSGMSHGPELPMEEKRTESPPGYFLAPKCNRITDPTSLWHHRLGHLNFRDLTRMAAEQLVLGLPTRLTAPQTPLCIPCIKGKAHRQPFPESDTRANKPGELLHADVCGPINPSARGGFRYFLVIVDDNSRFGKVYLLKKKGEATAKLSNGSSTSERSMGMRHEPSEQTEARSSSMG